MKIIYTESALEELEQFQKQRKDELESFLKEKKYVFGDDVVEITASDIREADRYFRVVDTSASKFPMTSILLKAYMFIGFAMVLVGLFYSDIKQLIDSNPMQLALVLGGVLLSLASFFGNYFIKLREDRRMEMEKRYREYESRSKTDI